MPFRDVADVMLGILTIPHSSANCKRVFSGVRKNKTDKRSSMGDDTLEALTVVKSSRVSCVYREYMSQTLHSLKGVYITGPSPSILAMTSERVFLLM